MKKEKIINFSGVIDGDTDPRLVVDGNYLYAENVYGDRNATPGALVVEAGSAQVPYTLPSGTNMVIGSCEDKASGSLFYFLKNLSGNHRILKWSLKSNSIIEVAAGNYLNFNTRIHSAHVVDGRYLCWVDGHSEATVSQGSIDINHGGVHTVRGNEPRKLDTIKSAVAGKVLTYGLYAGQPENAQFSAGINYIFRVKNLAGTLTIATATITSDGSYIGDPAAGLQWLSERIDLLLSDHVGIVVCDCKLQLSMKTTGVKLELSVSGDPQVILVPDNHYAAVLTDMRPWMISLAKEPPSCAPTPTYIGVPDVQYNNVRDGCFQFRTRFVYDNGELSAYSPVSVTALNNAQLSGPQDSLNAIEVDFTDERLNDDQWLSTIRYVELVFRNGNDDEFKLIERIPSCKIGSVKQLYVFKNDGLYSVVGSDDLSLATDNTQVLTNYHNVPRIAGALAPIVGEDGNLRLALGACLEGYDCPDCIDADATPTAYGNTEFVDIVGTVQMFNDSRANDTVMRFPNYALGGFVVYLAGTDYYGISNNPLDGSGDGHFIIRNVPKGRYSIRVASYMCRYDNSLGPRYNLLNGREWQRTSSPCVEVAGSLSYHGVDVWGEREINLYGFTGPVFDLDSESGYGKIYMQNCHNAPVASGLGLSGKIQLLEAHAVDNDGSYDTLEKRVSAIAVERLEVQFWQYDINGDNPQNGQSRRADHNGYSYASVNRNGGALSGWRPVIPVWGGFQATGAVPYAIYARDAGLYPAVDQESGWLMITGDIAGNLDPTSDPDVVEYTNNSKATSHAFCFNHDFDWSKKQKQTIKGKAVDANNVGIGGALIWMISNGRPEYTNSFGEFSFVFYGNNTPVRTAMQRILATYPPDAGGTYPPVPGSNNSVYNIDANSDGVADVFEVPTFNFGFSGGIVSSDRFLKSGGMYGIGIVYEDSAGRSCGVSPIKTVRIPFHTSDGQYTPRSIDWSISSIPPIWAVRYRIVRTKDSFYLTYRQTPVGNVRYAIIPDGATAPTLTTYGAGNATHILLSVGAKLDDAELPSGATLLMFSGPRKEGYRAKSDDRVRYLLDMDQDPMFSDRVLEVDVLGEYIDGDDYAVVIPYTEIFKEVKPGAVFEFFTPKGVEEQIYYETGICLEIDEPGLPGRTHKGVYQDQSISPNLPATGPIMSGDTYWWRESFVFTGDYNTALSGEHYRRSVYHTSKCEDIGRPFLFDPSAKETFYTTRIRVSGLYASGSQVNDLNNFAALDYQSLNRTFGPIKWLGMVHTVLLAICQNKSQSVYVGKGRVIDLSGNSIVGRVNSLLTVADESMADAGTLNPESVSVEAGVARWWDLQNAVVWSFGQNGTMDISDGRRKFFRTRQEERLPISDRSLDIVIGGYDRKHDLYFLSFMVYSEGEIEGAVNASRETLAYDVYARGWKSHFTWYPQCFGAINGEFVAFISANLQRFYRNTVTYGLIAGTQHQSSVTGIVNEGPGQMKDWFFIRIRGNRMWNSPNLYTLPDASYPSGMKSRLPSTRFILGEGVYLAEFLRDANDPHSEFLAISNVNDREATAMLRGRPLKGDCLAIKLQATVYSTQSLLFAATVCYGDSQITG